MGDHYFSGCQSTIESHPRIPSHTDIRKTEEAVWGSQYSPRPSYCPRPIGPRSVWWPRGVLWHKYCLWGVSYIYYPPLFMLYNCNAIVFIFWQEGSIATGILPTPNTSLSSLPAGSKVPYPKVCWQSDRKTRAKVQQEFVKMDYNCYIGSWLFTYLNYACINFGCVSWFVFTISIG